MSETGDAGAASLRGTRPRSDAWSLEEVSTRKRSAGTTVSVILPALDEHDPVGRIVSTLHPLVTASVIDELVVIDSGIG